MDVAGRKVLITGGARGFGHAMALAMAARGAEIAILDRDAEAMAALADAQPAFRLAICDVTDAEEVGRALDTLHDAVDCFDVIVNNAGIIHSSPLVNLLKKGNAAESVSAWDRVIATNLNAVYYVTLNAVTRMTARRRKGVIVNISSVAAVGNAGQGAYSAAKAGVNALTVAWAKELGPLGIRVVAVSPGFADIPSTHDAMGKTRLDQIVANVPLRRLARVEEVVGCVLSAIENDYINATVLNVDGGLRL